MSDRVAVFNDGVIQQLASPEELYDTIEELNADPEVHGYLVQDPVPEQIDYREVIRRIDPAKDVDGFHPENVGRLVAGGDHVRRGVDAQPGDLRQAPRPNSGTSFLRIAELCRAEYPLTPVFARAFDRGHALELVHAGVDNGFFNDIEVAKALCGTCPVQPECLAGALERREPWGVWGGQIFSGGRILTTKRRPGRPPPGPASP